jgi:energy-coupling factor transport system ATP-binding protein
MPIIHVEDVSFRYEGSERPALSNVSLDVNEGEILGILGPSEAGKTTLCMSLNGLIPHDIEGEFRGNIEIEGKNTRKNEPQTLATTIGMIFQEPESQFVMTTVEDEIAFGMENIGLTPREMEERLNWVLKVTHMEPYRKKPPRRLSGGQKQRVAIASALALRPKILVMDEPTSELDPLGKYEIITIAKELNREHKITIVLVEHETELAADIIDRLIVLNQGQIEFQGTPVELFGNIELMQKAGLFVPEVTEVARGLANSGFEISKLPITYAQGSSLLKALMKERGFGHG